MEHNLNPNRGFDRGVRRRNNRLTALRVPTRPSAHDNKKLHYRTDFLYLLPRTSRDNPLAECVGSNAARVKPAEQRGKSERPGSGSTATIRLL